MIVNKIGSLLFALIIFTGNITTTKATEINGNAMRRYALNSSELTGVVVVRGITRPLEEKSMDKDGASAPNFYKRRFEAVIIENQNNADVDKKQIPVVFSGFTLLAPLQRSSDTRSPALDLEGQAFFDSKLPTGSMNVLLLIGGPVLPSHRGFMGNSASMENGVYKGQPVRAFLIDGADMTLPEALPLLVGWQAPPTMAAAQAAMQAPHPLVAVDALRRAVRSGASDQVALLAQWLLHPAQAASVKATAIKLLGEAITSMPQGSKEVDKLIHVAIAGWEAERAYPIDATYLRALQSASINIKQSKQLEGVKAISEDDQIRELSTLAKQLANSLKK